MNDLVSIIIPVYNCEQFLKETIESVKKQSYINWELIIINDASTDNSLKVIEENIKECKEKVKLISLEENQGVANARNIGTNTANGKYIAFLDADDIWKNEKLEKQLKFMKENEYAFTYTSFTYLKDDRKKNVRSISQKQDYKDALKNTEILTSTVMIDVSKINKELIQMPNARRGQDAATWWKILRNGNTAYGLDERLTLYRRRKQSLSINKMTAMKRTWNLYRNVEKLNLCSSIFYFCCYAWNAVKRRIV